MKKILTIIIFGLFLLPLKAQERRFRAAAVGGLNLVQLDGDGLLGFHHFKLQGGLKVYTKLSERWEFGAGILFTQHGSKRAAVDNVPVFKQIDMNMVEVPVLMHFHEWKFIVNGGVSYARLINYRIINYKNEEVTEDYAFNPTMFSIILGATLNINEHFGVDLRWSKSLNSLYRLENGTKMKSRVFAIRGMYFF